MSAAREKPEHWGTKKVSLCLFLETNPGDEADAVAEAIEGLGLRLRAINQDVGKQRPYTPETLREAIRAHATALYGRTTYVLETPKAELHGPVSWVRIESGAYWGRCAAGQSAERRQFPCRLEVFWALGPSREALARTEVDAFARRLDRALTVRTGAAGLTFAVIERPRLKDAGLALAALSEMLLENPHAHTNHLAVLDTRDRCCEPGWWTFLGREHLRQVDLVALSAYHPVRFGAGGASLATAEISPILPSATVVRTQTELAHALGPLYPPRVVADATYSPRTPLANGAELTIGYWMGRYADATFLRELRFREP